MCILSAQALQAGYKRARQQHTVVQPFSAGLHAGAFTCLIGANGAGKSTLLRTLGGLQPPLQGQVLLEGTDLYRLSPRQRAQSLALILTSQPQTGFMTGYELVALGRQAYTDWRSTLTRADHAAVQRALERVDGLSLAGAVFAELSDGQRQRLMLARALAQEPRILLLDEPTAFLDFRHRVLVMELLQQLAAETQCAILATTHDLHIALPIAKTVWLLDNFGTVEVTTPHDLSTVPAFERMIPDGYRFTLE